ncbi:class I SAM-dependent methyltransferase [Paenibacillus oceani]|uniref:Class I SAM-dependent methyltransferase n=1 Tax=Paenibacillus oceani TaxID=2772510 RepID=A0A927C965_9BACL|nr:class I SAM-dependent methyltransferase [Paenibacillus oceani]MBD2863698.1 class I SAM-dependent methyltransferase [Paenibacillus oceani]
MTGVYKADLVAAYNRHAEERDQAGTAEWKVREREHFLKTLRKNDTRTLLEVGSGPGRDGLFFASAGLEVVCTDQSPEMVRICREKGLQAEVRSFDDLGFPDQSFDAVYALNCLLHVPKAGLPAALKEIRRVMKPDGLLYMGVYGGRDSEGVWEQDFYEPKRFFAMYTDENLLKAVSSLFRIVYFDTVSQGEGNPHFQSLILQPRQ